MKIPEHVASHLNELGLEKRGATHYLLGPAALYEMALARQEGQLAEHGPLVVRTDPHTGRAPDDRFIVKEAPAEEGIAWGEANRPIEEEVFQQLRERMSQHAEGRELFVQDAYAGMEASHRLPVRIITEKAWHSLFAHNMFVRRRAEALVDFEPGFTVLDLCEFKADPERDGTRSEAFVLISFKEKLILIGGTRYAGEIKKSIFSVLNYMLPEKGVLPMHSSANKGEEGEEGDTALFFGLSGTGKTTLSADASRTLIGDDEHGWGDDGVFNFEGGCYAKMIRLSPEEEPEIYSTTRRFGTILENVVVDPERRIPDFDDTTITENTRGSYPLYYIPNASPAGQGGHPKNIIFLACDSFGVMPPVARLNPEQAMYHFLSGYTAKVGGTEEGVKEPRATFSACFGEPFMVRPPAVYARLLGEKIEEHDVACWLVNTGWTGGAYGTGTRIRLKYTRAMVNAIHAGTLAEAETFTEPVFGFAVPKDVDGVPPEVLNPRTTWEDPSAYDQQAHKLANMFASNFEKYEDNVAPSVVQAGPKLEAVAR